MMDEKVRHDFRLQLAMGLGLGRSPIAPGTVGTLGGLPLVWAVAHLPHVVLQLAAIAGLGLVGVPLCTYAVRRLGSKDPGCVVWDEIASLPITFFLVPSQQWSRPSVLIAGFLLNRLFDISKIPPARQLERLPEGWGVMADDWAAGVYSCLALHALLHWILPGIHGG